MADTPTPNAKWQRWKLPFHLVLGLVLIVALLWLILATPSDRLVLVGVIAVICLCGAGIAYVANHSARVRTSLGVAAAVAALVAGLVSVLPERVAQEA